MSYTPWLQHNYNTIYYKPYILPKKQQPTLSIAIDTWSASAQIVVDICTINDQIHLGIYARENVAV